MFIPLRCACAPIRRLPLHSEVNDTATVTTEGGPPERFSLTNGTIDIGAGDNAIYTHDLRGQREPFYCICAEGYFGHLCDTSLSPTSSPTKSPSTAPLAILRAYANTDTDDTAADQDLTWLWVLLALALVSAAAAYAHRSRNRWRAAKSAGVTSTWSMKMSSFTNPAYAESGSTAASVRPSMHFGAWANEPYAPPAEPTYAVPIEGGVGSSVLVARQPDGRPVILNPTYAVPTESGGAPVLLIAAHSTNRMYTSADAQEEDGYVIVIPAEESASTPPAVVAVPLHCRSDSSNRMCTPADAQDAPGHDIPDGHILLHIASSAMQAQNIITMPMGNCTRYAVPMEEHADGYLSVGGSEDAGGRS